MFECTHGIDLHSIFACTPTTQNKKLKRKGLMRICKHLMKFNKLTN